MIYMSQYKKNINVFRLQLISQYNKIAFKKCFDYNLKKNSILKVLRFGFKEKHFKRA